MLRFRRLSLSLTLVLALVATGLGAINAVQGPRLSSAEVNPQALITRPNQQIILHTNQPITELTADLVSVSPAADWEVSVDQNSILLRFGDALNYATDYTVTIDAQSSSTGIGGFIEFTFTTPDIDVYSLLRDTEEDSAGNDQPDRVVRHRLVGDLSNEVVFEAPRIQEYVTLGDLLAAITLDPSGSPALVIASPDAQQIAVDTTDARTIRELHAAPSGLLFGYVVDAVVSADAPSQNTLFLYELIDGSGVPRPVRGFGGEPLNVMDWMFVPGTTSVIVQGTDQQLYLIDTTTGAEPKPLGQHTELRGFIPGTLQLVVADPLSGSLIDLEAGTTTTLSLPAPEILPDLYPGKLLLLGENRFLELFTAISYTPSATSSAVLKPGSVLFLTDSGNSREIFSTATGAGRIRDFCVSPQGEYAAVEVAAEAGRPDGYPEHPGYTASTIHFVRLSDGSSTRSVNGFMPDWCQ